MTHAGSASSRSLDWISVSLSSAGIGTGTGQQRCQCSQDPQLIDVRDCGSRRAGPRKREIGVYVSGALVRHAKGARRQVTPGLLSAAASQQLTHLTSPSPSPLVARPAASSPSGGGSSLTPASSPPGPSHRPTRRTTRSPSASRSPTGSRPCSARLE